MAAGKLTCLERLLAKGFMSGCRLQIECLNSITVQQNSLSVKYTQDLTSKTPIYTAISPLSAQPCWLRCRSFLLKYKLLMLKQPILPQKLQTIFNDHANFAWDILQQQVRVQITPNISGKDVADLLTLYMRAVEKLNSIHDSRETYFRNKVSSLMVKPTVIKVMSTNNKKAPQPPVANSAPMQKQVNGVHEERAAVSYSNLQNRKMEMQMHMTYQSESMLSKDKLTTMVMQHTNQINNIQDKINQVISEGSKRIDQRINERKLKAYSARTKSQKTLQLSPSRAILNQNIQVIEEEPDEPNQLKLFKQNKVTVNKKRAKSLACVRRQSKSPQAQPEKQRTRRRSTIVELHYKLTLDD